MSYSPKKDLPYLGAFFLLVLVFFSNFLKGDLIFAFKDLSRYFYPLRHLMVEEVMAGHLPLWNPYIFCGFPLLATLQIGFFYPLSLIYYLIPFNLAFNYYIIVHYFMAAAFTYFLLRHYRLERSAAFFGGMVFAFSGYLLSVSNMNTSLSSVVWLPLVLLFWDRVVVAGNTGQQGRSRMPINSLLIVALLLAIMFLGGEPTVIYTTGWLLIAYAALFSGSIRNFGWNVLGLLFSGLLAGGLVAVQLFPFAELSRYSDRIVLTGFDLITFRSFPPRELLNFIFPYFFGNPTHFGNYTEVILGMTFQDWLISPYIGILPLILVLPSLRRGRQAAFFGLCAFVALLLAFGKYTPVYGWLFKSVPGIALIRYPVKYLFLTTFCLSVLSAFGFSEVINWIDQEKGKLLKFIWSLAAIFALLAALSIFVFHYSTRLFLFFTSLYPKHIPPAVMSIMADIFQFDLQSLLNLTGYLFILLIIFAAFYAKKIERKTFITILIIISTADLFASGISTAMGVAPAVFNKPTATYRILMKEQGLFRSFYTPELENANRMVRGDTYRAALESAKDHLCANWHIPFHVYDFYGYESIQPLRLQNFYRKELAVANIKNKVGLLGQLNVKFLASERAIRHPQLALLRHENKEGQEFFLYLNREAKPRAYLIDGEGKVSIETYSYDQVGILSESKKENRLFLSDAYYPGWKARIDGREAEILPAKALFRSVRVPAGRHTVSFIYEPMSFKLGAGISLFTILIMLGLCIWGGQRELNP